MKNRKELIDKLFEKKISLNNQIDIDAYSQGLEDMFNELVSDITTPPLGESFIAYHPEDGLVEHFKTIEDAEEYVMEIEGEGEDGFSEAVMGGECFIAKKIKVSAFIETSNSGSDEYCQCVFKDECICKKDEWPYGFDSLGHIVFHNVE